MRSEFQSWSAVWEGLPGSFLHGTLGQIGVLRDILKHKIHTFHLLYHHFIGHRLPHVVLATSRSLHSQESFNKTS